MKSKEIQKVSFFPQEIYGKAIQFVRGGGSATAHFLAPGFLESHNALTDQCCYVTLML